jgi:hypothetical protein
MLRIISEQTLDIDEELCACFIDCQQVFEHVKWIKLMQTLKETGIYWHKRRLISRLYMNELDKGATRRVKTGRGGRQGCCLSPILFEFTANTLPRKLFKGFETSK